MTDNRKDLLSRMGSVLLIALIGLGHPIAEGQDDDERPASTWEYLPVYFINMRDGQFQVNTLDLHSWNDGFEWRRFLAHPTVRQELELTEDQSRRLDHLIKQARDFREQLPARIGDAGSDLELRRLLARHVRWFHEEIDKILLAHQRRAAEQLMIRFQLRQNGWLSQLCRGALGDQLELQPDQKSRLVALGKECAQTYSPKTLELRQQFFREITAILTPEQRRAFERLGEDFFERRMPPLEVIEWQAANVEQVCEWLKYSHHRKYIGITCSASFVVDLDGKLHGTKELNLEFISKKREVQKPKNDFNYFVALASMLTNDWLGEELGLSELQIERIRELFDNMNEIENRHLRAYSGPHLTEEAKSEVIRQFNREVAPVAEQSLAEIEQLLLPMQLELLERISECGEMVKCGMVYAFQHGQLGKRLKITAQQAETIQRTADKLVREFRQKSRQWEQEIIDALMEVLTPIQRERFRDLIGPDLKHAAANLDLLILDLANPYRNK